MIDVLCATTGDRAPAGLEHIPSDYRLLTDTRPGWAAASNALLDQSEHDVLFIDDDVTITPFTFDLFDRYYDKADVIGFTLISPYPQGGWGISSAGHALDNQGNLLPRRDVRDVLTPGYVAHVTTSCIFVKRHVVQAGLRFPVWPGVHGEDVAFTLDAWLRGFRVLYMPGVVEHPLTWVNVGVTKAQTPDLQQRLAENKAHLEAWMRENDIIGAARAGRIPIGTKEVQ